MTITPQYVHDLVRDSPTPAHGLQAVLMECGVVNVSAELIAATADAIQAWTGGEVHQSIIREKAEHWREPQARRLIEWELRERALRTLNRDGCVFAATPVITIHPIDPINDPGLSPGPALTDEQAEALPRYAWIEVRLTVPFKPLPDSAPSAPEPALEPR